MDLLPIRLTARRGNWQRFMARRMPTNKAFLAIKEKVLTRDDFTCRYCGFQSKRFQEVVNIDHNYSNNSLNNLATACTLCYQCFFLDCVGMDGRSGATVIHMPEVTQADLNHFCRALFCSLLRDPPYKGKLQAVYMSLQDRGQTVDTLLGPNSHEPVVFGQTLIDSQLNENQLSHSLFTELRLLPIRKYYKQQAEYWKTTLFAHIPL